jgi:hypothetical protein
VVLKVDKEIIGGIISMATTSNEIRTWLNRGMDEEATHVIVVTDTFNYEDYPYFVKSGENIKEIIEQYEKSSLTRITEIYNMSMDIEAQLNEKRTYNL